MKKIDAILMCYGKDALEQHFEIEIRGVLYCAWMIERIETKEELEKIYCDTKCNIMINSLFL